MRAKLFLMVTGLAFAAGCSSDNVVAVPDAAVAPDTKPAADGPVSPIDAPHAIDAPHVIDAPHAFDTAPVVDAPQAIDAPRAIDAPPPVDAKPVPDAVPGTPDAAPVVQTAYVITALTILDPHIYVDAFGILCTDGTSTANSQFTTEINGDQNNDGNRDFSILIDMSPLDQTNGATTDATIEYGVCSCQAPGMTVCPAASTSTTCGPADPMIAGMITNQASGTCLAALPNTTTASYGTIPSTTGPCFASAPLTITVNFMGVAITLEDAVAAGVYMNNPATGITNGLIRGFLSEAVANSIVLDLSSFGGSANTPISALIPGGANCCENSDHSDLDTGPNGEPGWYMYLTYTAQKVTYTP